MVKASRVLFIVVAGAVVVLAVREETSRQVGTTDASYQASSAPTADAQPAPAQSRVLESEILRQAPQGERIAPVISARSPEVMHIVGIVPPSRYPHLHAQARVAGQPQRLQAQRPLLDPGGVLRQQAPAQVVYAPIENSAVIAGEPQHAGLKTRIVRFFRRIKARLADL